MRQDFTPQKIKKPDGGMPALDLEKRLIQMFSLWCAQIISGAVPEVLVRQR